MPAEDLPTWDDDRARGLIGKTVLLGLTFATPDGDVVEQVQRHGVIEHADPEKGIGVRLIGPGQVWDGELYELPPDLRPFSEAAPGSYRLRSTVRRSSTRTSRRPGRSARLARRTTHPTSVRHGCGRRSAWGFPPTSSATQGRSVSQAKPAYAQAN
jgi:hypothetical protein